MASPSRPSTSKKTAVRVAPDLRDVMSRAALLNQGDPQKIEISFTSLLIGFLAGSDSWSVWLQDYISRRNINIDPMLTSLNCTRARLDEVRAMKPSETQLARADGGNRNAYKWTSSAQRLARASDELRGGNKRATDERTARHMLAAYIYKTPGDHVEQIRGWGFDQHDWGQSFLEQIRITNPDELDYWEQVHRHTYSGEAAGSAPPEPPQVTPDRTTLQLDNASFEDKLGRKGFAQALAEQINRIWDELRDSRKKASFIMHVHGPWGSGKTSLLNLMRSELQPQQKPNAPGSGSGRWIVIDFNAWQQQRIDPPWWTLLDFIYRQSVAQLKTHHGKYRRAWWIQVREQWWRFAGGRGHILTAFVVFVLLLALSAPTWVGVMTSPGTAPLTSTAESAKAISGIVALLGTIWSGILIATRFVFLNSARSAQSFMQQASDPMAAVSSHFHRLVGMIGQPVIIYIDDLDRCQQAYVVQLLEGMQTLFNDSRVVYVVTADRRWLYTCFENTYKQFADSVKEPGRRLGALFLEKAFEFSVSLPRLSREMKEAYWDFLIMGKESQLQQTLDHERASADADFATARTQSEVFAKLEKPGDQPLVRQIRREAAVRQLAKQEVEASTQYFLHQFAHLLEPNPRAMKRLMNAYTISRAIAILSGVDLVADGMVRQKQLVLWTIVTLRWPLLEEFLQDHPEQVDNICRGKGRFPDDIRTLVTTSDVRDVFEGRNVGTSLTQDAVNILAGFSQSEPGAGSAA